jgi:predicted MFS family arabinose efflux permease
VLLGVCLLLGLAIAGLLGVDLWRALDLNLQHTWTVWAALGVQLVIFSPLAGRLPHSTIAPLHIGSYALIGIFLALNLRVAGMPLISVGWLANTTAIAVNGGRMPITLHDWELSGRAATAITKTGVDNNNMLARHAQLGWLGDIFPLPARVPLANAFSIGDVLIVAGAVAVVSLAGTRRTSPRAALSPLRERAFLRLTAARGLSQFGDWITMAAAVTWLYARTGATWPVSCYLIARITASLVGGLVGPRLIGRPGRERFATVFAVRGALTAGALLAAAGGGPTLMAAVLLVLSAAVAPITNAATAALTPNTVPDAILHRANALSGFILELAVVAGAAVGGLAETRFGLSVPLGIDVGTFAVAAITLAGATVRPHTAREAADPVKFAQLAGRLLRHTAARPLLLSFAVATAAVGMVNASLPRFMSHLPANGGYGIAIACIGAGAMLGGILVGSINESRAIRRSVTLGFAGMAVAVALLADTAAPATASLILIVVGLLDATTEVSYATILQEAFAGAHLAATLTAATVFISAGMAVGFAVAAVANARLTPEAALLLPAGTCAVAALLAIPLALRRRPGGEAESLATILARGVLELPALVRTPLGSTIAVVAESHGRWLAYPADAFDPNRGLRLQLPGYEIAADAVAPAPHNGMWIEITDVTRNRQAA